jgi:NAD(P)-dependent dehydrogenase (short-subunit alcohol dehydrogenase family)
MRLDGKVALVTGGANGIGRATAVRLSQLGARVVVVDRDAAGATAIASKIGGEALVLDVADFAANQGMVDDTLDRFGRLDFVHLNAGVVSGIGIGDDFSLERYRHTVGVNLDAVVFGTHAVLPALRAVRGAIVATASLAGLSAQPLDPLYCATKHAVVGLARALGPALAPAGVRFNAVCPGFVDTPLLARVRNDLPPGSPVMAVDDVASVVVDLLTGLRTGECWFVQPGHAGSFQFRGVPGPRISV